MRRSAARRTAFPTAASSAPWGSTNRREGQTAQPADLSREQYAGGAGWPEPRSNTQAELAGPSRGAIHSRSDGHGRE